MYDAVPTNSFGLGPIADGTIAFGRTEGDVSSVGVMSLADEILWMAPTGLSSGWAFDPSARLWRIQDPDLGRVRDRHGDDLWWADRGLTRGIQVVWGADGSAIFTSDAARLRRVDGATGEILWEIPVGRPGDSAQVLALDIDGRLYLHVEGAVRDAWGAVPRIVAVQTDVTAARTVCLATRDGRWCNRHNNNALYDYGAVLE